MMAELVKKEKTNLFVKWSRRRPFGLLNNEDAYMYMRGIRGQMVTVDA